MAKSKGRDGTGRLTEFKELWKRDPEEHDFPAAAGYLSLVFSPDQVSKLVEKLQTGSIEHRYAKDILRASGLPLLPPENFHVKSDLEKVKKGVSLSPVLLVRGDQTSAIPLVIADGYHRICASYAISEDEEIPCVIADRPIRTASATSKRQSTGQPG